MLKAAWYGLYDCRFLEKRRLAEALEKLKAQPIALEAVAQEDEE